MSAHSTPVAKSNKCFVRFSCLYFFFSFLFLFLFLSTHHSAIRFICAAAAHKCHYTETRTTIARTRTRHSHRTSNWTAEACGHLNGIGKTKTSHPYFSLFFDDTRFQVAAARNGAINDQKFYGIAVSWRFAPHIYIYIFIYFFIDRMSTRLHSHSI